MDITNYCVENHCSRCGRCCSDFIFISEPEIKQIKTYLKAHPEVREQHAQPDLFGNLKILCPFYDEVNKKCLIYKVRPKICRLFKCNQPIEKLEAIKKEFHAPKYYNVETLKSLHLIFFNNPTHQLYVGRQRMLEK